MVYNTVRKSSISLYHRIIHMTVVTKATIQAAIAWTQIDTPNPNYTTATVEDAGSVSFAKILTSGTGNSAINNVWWDTTGVIPSGGKTTYNFSSISRGLFGATLESNFTNIKAIIIENKSSGTNSIYVTATGTNGFKYPFNGASSGLIIPPLSPAIFINYISGWTVDATHKILQLNNSANTGIGYRMGVLGVGD